MGDCDEGCPCTIIRGDRERRKRKCELKKKARARREAGSGSDTSSDSGDGDSDDDLDLDSRMFDFREGGTKQKKIESGKWYFDASSATTKDKSVIGVIDRLADDLAENVHLHAHVFSTCTAESFMGERASDNPKT